MVEVIVVIFCFIMVIFYTYKKKIGLEQEIVKLKQEIRRLKYINTEMEELDKKLKKQ